MKVLRGLAAVLVVVGLAACSSSTPVTLTDRTGEPVTAKPMPTDTSTAAPTAPPLRLVAASRMEWHTHCALAFCAKFPYLTTTGDGFAQRTFGKGKTKGGHFISIIYRTNHPQTLCASPSPDCYGHATIETYSVDTDGRQFIDQWGALGHIPGAKSSNPRLIQGFRAVDLVMRATGLPGLAVIVHHKLYVITSSEEAKGLKPLFFTEFIESVRFS